MTNEEIARLAILIAQAINSVSNSIYSLTNEVEEIKQLLEERSIQSDEV